MKIESIKAILVDPVRMEKSYSGPAATAQTSRSKSKEAPQRTLQEESRSADEIQQDIAEINDQLKSMNRSIRFSVDERSKDIVVTVVDKNTGEVVMQLPPEEILRLRERLNKMSGLLVEKQI